MQLIEPVDIADVVVSGLAYSENVEGWVRLSFYRTQRSALDGSSEHIVTARLFMPQRVAIDLAPTLLRDCEFVELRH